MKNSHFSIAVLGKSLLLDPFIAYGCEEFPRATWYDRSDSTNAARGVEAGLGAKGLTREQDRAMARRTAQSLANPKPTTVTATFTASGYNNKTVIEGRRRSRTVTINTADLTERKFEKAMDELLLAVRKVL